MSKLERAPRSAYDRALDLLEARARGTEELRRLLIRKGEPAEEVQKNTTGPQRIFVLDGSTVHNVGELQMNVGNWGMFESVMSQPAGQGATVDFRFRNGKKVKFDARAIKVDLLLADWVAADRVEEARRLRASTAPP